MKLSNLNYQLSTQKGFIQHQLRRSSAGFTLIELLVVMAIIGILAVGLMTVINPVEQINRGSDTGNTSDAKQLLDAVNRFYANQGYYPWQTSATAIILTGPIEVGSGWVNDAGTPVLTVLSSNTSGGPEINSSFVNKVTTSSYNKLYVYNGSTSSSPNQSTYVCYKPKSISGLDKGKAKWNNCNSSTMSTFSDLGAGSGPYMWPSGGPAILTICDSTNNLFATCLP